MYAQIARHQPKTPVGQAIRRVLTTGKITRQDENYFLIAMRNEAALNAEEEAGIRQIYERLQMGLLRVVN